MADQETAAAEATSVQHREQLDRVTIRFAGDSGDGMQLTGVEFTKTSALSGNDLRTLPDFPAEIRAPAGTVAGVSGYQIQIGATDVYTPGDQPDVLVAMNPAALRNNLGDLRPGATIVLNSDTFSDKALNKAGWDDDPLSSGVLEPFQVIQVPLNKLTHTALEQSPLSKKAKDRSKNFFALGLTYWLYGRPVEPTLDWIGRKFAKSPDLVEANRTVLKAGYHYGETTEVFTSTYEVPAAPIAPGLYRHITGNQALAYGFIAASELTDLDLLLGSYPITPASDILHELSKHKNFRVRTVQAEDEIAAVCAAIGAGFGGGIGLTTTSGPGVALKAEAIGLAAIVEVPLVIVNVQRGGPSTGLPTKTEQADLLQAMFGRNGESSVPIVAPSNPSDCFWVAIEAVRLATKYMTPVFMLSDGYIANGAEPWRIPSLDELPKLPVGFRTETEGFAPYLRDPETLARSWVRPGTPGLEHRIGGLEKDALTGEVSYDPDNHEHMVRLRAEKIDRIAEDIPDAELFGHASGKLLYVGWGSTYGALRAAAIEGKRQNLPISHLHLRHLNPLPGNIGDVLRSFDQVVVTEMNLGQMRRLLRERFLVDCQGLNKIKGRPFTVSEIMTDVRQRLD